MRLSGVNNEALGIVSLAQGVEHAPMRLVCASDAATLESTAKYLARTLAAEPFDADARLTLPGRILRDKRDATTKAIGDAASARLGADLVQRFVDEIDRLDVDLRFGSPSIGLSFDLRLSGRESMLARVLVPRSKPTAPPRAFYRLPGDSLLALHTTGAHFTYSPDSEEDICSGAGQGERESAVTISCLRSGGRTFGM